eukprot:Plantae.Rhodophyta-Rhodochaete_pulchella.ctg4430.p3 GENE.Plantae.Rhodophyta-Rhodochaete_pulchella.ctg4430~~Plantae.Rhodophyta-Rhodochaete_pulchella.ctg4430.p3  ORF type:complete len:100 (-),score=9.43 Plantae.Rhodophyta-Rhodochaete_pulchella.ctg4430:579-878(-)
MLQACSLEVIAAGEEHVGCFFSSQMAQRLGTILHNSAKEAILGRSLWTILTTNGRMSQVRQDRKTLLRFIGEHANTLHENKLRRGRERFASSYDLWRNR